MNCIMIIHKISHDMLSNYCSNIAYKYGIKICGVNKLVPNLSNKSKYSFHYKNLQIYSLLGMKLTKVRRDLKLKHSDSLKKYINFNTDKIKNPAYSFGKDFFKLMNNSIFGESMKKLRKRINVRLINDAEDYKKNVNKPSFVPQKIFSKNFVAIHEIKPVLTLDKPIYVRFSILDLSKYLMYEFHCKYIKSTYNAKLLFTDTDRLAYEIKTCL